jgi:hypothetical protein
MKMTHCSVIQKLSFLAILATVAVSSGCGSKVEGGLGGINASSTSLSYNMTEGDCSTGDQSFSSTEDLCAGLLNDKLNKYCATNLRKGAFKQSCPGQTWAPR